MKLKTSCPDKHINIVDVQEGNRVRVFCKACEHFYIVHFTIRNRPYAVVDSAPEWDMRGGKDGQNDC